MVPLHQGVLYRVAGKTHLAASSLTTKRKEILMYDILSTIITGLVVGALARFFLKGNQNLGMLWTIILGILGAFIGSFLTGVLFPNSVTTGGIDWIRWILMILSAMVCVAIYLGATRGRSSVTSR